MRKFMAALVATVALSGVATKAAATPPRTIYIVNDSQSVSNTKFRDALPAFQRALNDDFAPAWGTHARLVFLGRKAAPKGAEVVDLVEFPDCWFCGGYHEFVNGRIDAQVGTNISLGNWQIIFTHELWEMLADPYADNELKLARKVTLADGTQYVVETADPVESSSFAYTRLSRTRKTVRISDFVTPAWFDDSSTGGWDFTGSVQRPLQILLGGYQILKRVGQDWTTVNNFDQVVSDGDE